MIHKLATDPAWPGNMKLKLRSDGTSEGTTVLAVDSDGAEFPIEAVMAVTWSIDITKGDPLAKATISFVVPAAELATVRAPEVIVDAQGPT